MFSFIFILKKCLVMEIVLFNDKRKMDMIWRNMY